MLGRVSSWDSLPDPGESPWLRPFPTERKAMKAVPISDTAWGLTDFLTAKNAKKNGNLTLLVCGSCEGNKPHMLFPGFADLSVFLFYQQEGLYGTRRAYRDDHSSPFL